MTHGRSNRKRAMLDITSSDGRLYNARRNAAKTNPDSGLSGLSRIIDALTRFDIYYQPARGR